MLLFRRASDRKLIFKTGCFHPYCYIKKHISNFKQQCKCITSSHLNLGRHREQSMTGLNEIKLFLYLWSVFAVLNAELQTRCSLLLDESPLSTHKQLYVNTRTRQSIISFILTLVHFWHFTGSQIVPAALRRKLGPLSLPEPKENKTSLCCGLFIKCALCICPLGTNKHVNKVPQLFTWPESTNRLHDGGAKCQMTPACVGGDGPQRSAAAAE